MTVGFALEYIKQRMCDCGYTMSFRHLVLQPGEKRTLQGHNQMFLLIEPPCDARIESDTGVFDQSEGLTNELQYEHNGEITITNHSIFINRVRMIQVVSINCKNPCT